MIFGRLEVSELDLVLARVDAGNYTNFDNFSKYPSTQTLRRVCCMLY
jgi:hypothetical protein